MHHCDRHLVCPFSTFRLGVWHPPPALKGGECLGLFWPDGYFSTRTYRLWLGWQLATLAGLLAGEIIPASWGLDFALPLTFIAVVVPAARDRADWAAIVVAGTAALAFAALPYKLAILVAAILGISAGMWMKRRRHQ